MNRKTKEKQFLNAALEVPHKIESNSFEKAEKILKGIPNECKM